MSSVFNPYIPKIGPDWISAPISPIPLGGTKTTLAHTLGAVPSFAIARFACLTANNGFAAGDVFDYSNYILSSTAGHLMVLRANSIDYAVGSQGIWILLPGGNNTYISNSTAWELTLRLWQ